MKKTLSPRKVKLLGVVQPFSRPRSLLHKYRIYNKRNGVMCRVVIKTLSADNNTINNEDIRMDKEGKITRVTHATYHRRRR